MGGAHLQCVKNHHVKYEYKGMNTVGVANEYCWSCRLHKLGTPLAFRM